MIQEGNTYLITFSRDAIRGAAGDFERVNGSWKWVTADLTDEQCDAIAEELASLFESEFYKNVKSNMEV